MSSQTSFQLIFSGNFWNPVKLMLVFVPALHHFKSFINVIHISLIIFYISIVGPLWASVLELYIKINILHLVYLKLNQYIKNVKYHNLYACVLVIMWSKPYLWSDNKLTAVEHVVT